MRRRPSFRTPRPDDWRDDEIELLTSETARRIAIRFIARKLGRTEAACYAKARLLGLELWDRRVGNGSRRDP